MDEKPTQEMIDHWQRWFAVECNNLTWDLASKDGRTEQDTQKMLYAAYAAAFHWSTVGQLVNNARADATLAHALALAGQGEQAMFYARRCLEYFEKQPATDWDYAFALAEVALAAYVQGNASLHREYYAKARESGEAISDPEDRRIFMAELLRIPVP